jgi:predicted nucleotidyltransferase
MINLADLLGDKEVDKEVLKYLADHEQAALTEFLARLREQHGSEVVLVSLFGSKARGDFDEESDIDVLLVVENRNNQLWEDIVGIEAELMLKYDTVISSLIMSRDNYEWHLRHRAPLYRNIEREGIGLWTSVPRSSSASD